MSEDILRVIECFTMYDLANFCAEVVEMIMIDGDSDRVRRDQSGRVRMNKDER